MFKQLAIINVGEKQGRDSEHTIVIEPKENGQENGERNGQEDISGREVPKVDEPVGRVMFGVSREKCPCYLELLELQIAHGAHVGKASEEDEGDWGRIVLDENAHVMLEQVTLADFSSEVCKNKHEEGNGNRHVLGGKNVGLGELLTRLLKTVQHLDALLEVDKGHVEAKDVAWEPRHVLEPVARIGDSQDPVEYHGPSTK